jgi:SOS-response transcriptional repressor LexA
VNTLKEIDINVLNAVKKHFMNIPYAPSAREIADALNINSSGLIHESLARLRDGGLVTWTPNKVRTLALTEAGKNYH